MNKLELTEIVELEINGAFDVSLISPFTTAEQHFVVMYDNVNPNELKDIMHKLADDIGDVELVAFVPNKGIEDTEGMQYFMNNAVALRNGDYSMRLAAHEQPKESHGFSVGKIIVPIIAVEEGNEGSTLILDIDNAEQITSVEVSK